MYSRFSARLENTKRHPLMNHRGDEIMTSLEQRKNRNFGDNITRYCHPVRRILSNIQYRTFWVPIYSHAFVMHAKINAHPPANAQPTHIAIYYGIDVSSLHSVRDEWVSLSLSCGVPHGGGDGCGHAVAELGR